MPRGTPQDGVDLDSQASGRPTHRRQASATSMVDALINAATYILGPDRSPNLSSPPPRGTPASRIREAAGGQSPRSPAGLRELQGASPRTPLGSDSPLHARRLDFFTPPRLTEGGSRHTCICSNQYWPFPYPTHCDHTMPCWWLLWLLLCMEFGASQTCW